MYMNIHVQIYMYIHVHVYCIHIHIVTHFTDIIIFHYVHIAEDSLVVINRLAQEQKTVSYLLR